MAKKNTAKVVMDAKLREYFRKLGLRGGSKGGSTRAARMTPEERSESARVASLARWSKVRASKRKTKGT